MPQEVDSVTPKLAFGEVDDQTVPFKPLKGFLEVLFMSFHILASTKVSSIHTNVKSSP